MLGTHQTHDTAQRLPLGPAEDEEQRVRIQRLTCANRCAVWLMHDAYEQLRTAIFVSTRTYKCVRHDELSDTE